MINAVIQSFAYLALLGDIAIISLVALWLFKVSKIKRLLAKHAYVLAFFLSLTATLASLFLSEVAKFQPCALCWYQRIAMYPQPLLLYLALLRNERVLSPYLIALSLFGSLVSIYHYSLHVLPKSFILNCDPGYGGVSCVEGYAKFFGFMTFPFMALTVFILLIILLTLSNSKKQAPKYKQIRNQKLKRKKV